MDKYSIPLNYKIRENNAHHNDMDETDKYQKEVYLYVKSFMETNNLKKVIDIGCGSGYKLIKYLGNFETIGYETEPCISFLRNKYPNNTWINSGESEKSFGENNNLQCDIIMASDVIEHIRDPNKLIEFMKTFNTKYFLISTPCRKILAETMPKWAGKNINGPPKNEAHIREWTYEEFIMYLNKHFKVLHSELGKEQKACHWHLCGLE